MASGEDTCWRCGVVWAADEPRTMPRLVAAGASNEAGLDMERWINEGGSVAAARG